MSYFAPTNIVYIFVPELEVTEEMLNHMKKDFSTRSIDDLKTSNEALPVIRDKLLKIKLNPETGIPNVFSEYQWYNETDKNTELAQARWQGPSI